LVGARVEVVVNVKVGGGGVVGGAVGADVEINVAGLVAVRVADTANVRVGTPGQTDKLRESVGEGVMDLVGKEAGVRVTVAVLVSVCDSVGEAVSVEVIVSVAEGKFERVPVGLEEIRDVLLSVGARE